MNEAKPFLISKREVWEAYQRVKANKGAAGIDEQSITEFEKDLKDNLYKLWNRMSSGSYFPPPVRTVKIPKASGGERKLGIPTIADRIAQTVVKAKLEPRDRTPLPSQFVWLSSRPIRIGCGRTGPTELLGL
jgi:retron-type reverse transcriptase